MAKFLKKVSHRFSLAKVVGFFSLSCKKDMIEALRSASEQIRL